MKLDNLTENEVWVLREALIAIDTSEWAPELEDAHKVLAGKLDVLDECHYVAIHHHKP